MSGKYAMLREEQDPGDDCAQELVLEDFLPYRLNILAEIVSHSLAGVYSRQYGIGIPEWRVIANLGSVGKLSAKQIGDRAHMHKTKVSRAAAALEESGLIVRSTDSSDKRSAILSLTDKGRDVYSRIVPVALEFASELQSVLDPADVKALDRVLSKLKRKSQEMAGRMTREIE
jgi:DNA-binding MarR family transcriptional regulator